MTPKLIEKPTELSKINMSQSQWAKINDSNDRFRLLCDNSDCSLSIGNLLSGRIHITTVHGNERHSYTFTNKDMLFVISQFMKTLSVEDRKKILEFYSNF